MRRPEPNEYPARLSINKLHQPNLMVSLIWIILINTQCVNPENTIWLAVPSDCLERIQEIRPDGDEDVVDPDFAVQLARLAPHVRESFIAAGVGNRAAFEPALQAVVVRLIVLRKDEEADCSR